MSDINWTRVSENLRCPQCGDRASIEAGSDGSQGYHTHRFSISRELARQLSKPTAAEVADMRRQAVSLLIETGIDEATRVALQSVRLVP